jgi:dihydrofolate synthase/folylpolyglutamate synthase
MNKPSYHSPNDLDHLIRILSSFTNYEKNRDFHKGRIRCDLENIEKLCRAAGDPQRSVACIHVAGSKGKGSTVGMLDAILRGLGLKTGAFTSPHLTCLTERIAVKGEPLSEEAFLVAADRALDLLRENDDFHPTFFEFITVAAMMAFRDLGVEAALFETGLGGRLDATNVVLPEVSVITTIEKEHCAVLGETLEEIAGEKAGIIKPGIPIVTSLRPEHPGRSVLEERAALAGARLFGPGAGLEIAEQEGGRIAIEMEGERHGPFQPPRPRALQSWNLACSLAAARLFTDRKGIDWDSAAVRNALDTITLPGRFEILGEKPLVIVDGAHTPSSIRAGLEEASAMLSEPPVVVLGLAEDKDVPGIVDAVLSSSRAVFYTPYQGGRAVVPERLQALGGGAGTLTTRPDEALDLARKAAGPRGGVMVTGSFYLAGEIRAILAP